MSQEKIGQRLDFRVKPAQAGQRLDLFVREQLSAYLDPSGDSELSKTKVRNLILKGLVLVSLKPVKNPAMVLVAKARVSLDKDFSKYLQDKVLDDLVWELQDEAIIYEDEVFLFINKPAGLPCEPGRVESRDTVYAAVQRFMARREKSDEIYLALPHRLDRETSGLLCFVKDRRFNKAVFDLFAQRELQKTYIYLCRKQSQPMPDLWQVHNFLGRLSSKSTQAKWGAVEKDGLEARTDFTRLAEAADFLFVQAQPRSGRTHQIRVHSSEAGWPLLGDTLYGDSGSLGSQGIPRCMLHARRLEFQHPSTGRRISLEAPLPKDFLEILSRVKNLPAY